MSQQPILQLSNVIKGNETDLVDELLLSIRSRTVKIDKISELEIRQQALALIKLLAANIPKTSIHNLNEKQWDNTKQLLTEYSQSRARQGFTPAETAGFILSFKEPVFKLLRLALQAEPEQLAEEIATTSALFDNLGLYTIEVYQKVKEQLISRQQQELLELSTPVIQLWDDILALPLIGTLDSGRTQIVMENLLQKIVETAALIAIIDITGVPTVDTLVAQHLMKTIAATRLMGADCIISGIRPQIAQTIVHLGVNLNDIVTKATLADAFAVALQRTSSHTAKPFSL